MRTPLRFVVAGFLTSTLGAATLSSAQTVPVLQPEETVVTSHAAQSVQLHGKWMVVGAPFRRPGEAARPGFVFLYERTGNADCNTQSCWTRRAELNRPDPLNNDRFGDSLRFNGKRLVVGSPATTAGSEAAFVYERQGTTFQLLQALQGDPHPPGVSFSNFGTSVDFHGPRIAVSESVFPSNGGAYVFDHGAEGSWTRTAKLVPVNVDEGDQNGWTVEVRGNTVMSGADGGNYATVFTLLNGAWQETQTLIPWDGASGSFGHSISIRGNRALIGAFSPRTFPGGGSAYIFERSQGTWNPAASLTHPEPFDNDAFGIEVAQTANRIAVLDRAHVHLYESVGASWVEEATLEIPALFDLPSTERTMGLTRSRLALALAGVVFVYDLSELNAH